MGVFTGLVMGASIAASILPSSRDWRMGFLCRKNTQHFWRWAAIFIGFLGTVLVIKPGSDIFNWNSILPI
ncbi:MAG: hypothetical protein VXW20_04880, partial [Pseudomonadota bacterium]|nr:hypothetical protein [Pseudomonadota bacterium]